jgi:hypothetical protein
MIRTISVVVSSAAQAMPSAPVHRLDAIITQARMGCAAGRVMVNGVCQSRVGMCQERRANTGVHDIWRRLRSVAALAAWQY